MNKVKWAEGTKGLTVYVDEGEGWVLYTQSKLGAIPNSGPGENPAFSTFQAAIKAGYQVIDINGNPI